MRAGQRRESLIGGGAGFVWGQGRGAATRGAEFKVVVVVVVVVTEEAVRIQDVNGYSKRRPQQRREAALWCLSMISRGLIVRRMRQGTPGLYSRLRRILRLAGFVRGAVVPCSRSSRRTGSGAGELFEQRRVAMAVAMSMANASGSCRVRGRGQKIYPTTLGGRTRSVLSMPFLGAALSSQAEPDHKV